MTADAADGATAVDSARAAVGMDWMGAASFEGSKLAQPKVDPRIEERAAAEAAKAARLKELELNPYFRDGGARPAASATRLLACLRRPLQSHRGLCAARCAELCIAHRLMRRRPRPYFRSCWPVCGRAGMRGCCSYCSAFIPRENPSCLTLDRIVR